ncbi:MAG TPA: zf-HC2 domain-containing protein [Thermoanaerobaculia bacterium]|nr:zf-HC2 domain-containing protein [Thermoanaerobaculia bacterium]
MTCRAARRLLPLFAGGDLKAPRTGAVAGHVAACAACHAEVEAFRAARSLLPLSSLSFDESERALVRRRVLDEIAATQGRPSLLSGTLLRPRFALAAFAGALVLAASLVSPFFVRNAGERVAALPAPPVPPAVPGPVGERTGEAALSPPVRSTANFPVARAKRAHRPPVPASAQSGPTVRFEIQTGNVNVRIIWFAGGNTGGEALPDPNGEPNGVS